MFLPRSKTEKHRAGLGPVLLGLGSQGVGILLRASGQLLGLDQLLQR